MKKHLLVCLLALALASLCMLPSRVQAAEETHNHCTCGADHVSIGVHTTDSSSWTKWKALTPDSNGHVTWPEGGNYYYLTGDVELTETWVVHMTSPIVLCLNGHNITMKVSGPAIEVDGTSTGINASLVITDCTGEGKITRAANANDPVVRVCGYGSFTMYGGTITGNHVNGNGGGVYVDGTNGSFTMYGGTITNNSATGSGGGVYVDGERSSFTMYGGTITNNSATGSGGGVYVGKETKTYVWVGGNAQIAGNTVGGKTDSGICFSASNQRLSVKNKLITDARIVIDNSDPATYITDKSAGNYAIDTTNGVLTAPLHKSHYLCGSSDNANCTSADCKDKGEVAFEKWEESDSLPTSTGKYYLTKNVTLSTVHTFTGDVTLCLNGYKIEAASDAEDGILVGGGTLTITDCVGSGSIVGVGKQHTGVNIQYNEGAGTLNLYGGTIRNFAIGVTNSGTFNMYGGKLTKNSQGVSNTGTFNMHGGTITKNSGYCNGAGVSNEGNFTMSGGDITSNTASQSGTENNGFGGGVHNRSSFVMTDGTITGNTAKNNGGGVYSVSNSTYIYGGSITSNNAKRGDDVYAASNCGVHLKGNVTIGSDRSNGLLTNTMHYIDGPLDGSKIRLSVPNGTTNGTELLRPGESHKITPEDLKKFSLKNGYEVTLNDKGNGVLILPHKHTLCNRTTHTGAGHSGSCDTSITFEEWTDAEAKKMYHDTAATAANCLPNEGDWYLTNPVTLTAPHVVDGGELNLCLNGNNVILNAEGAVFSVKNGGELNLTDCKSTGIITHADSKNGTGVSVEAGGDGTAAGTFNLYNGNITGNSNSDNGGGVSVLSDGQFNMYGGTITENKAATGGGVYFADNATVTISGGTITNNVADSDGGGMTVGNCQVTLSGRVTITGNKSTDGKSSNLYIKGGKGVTIDSSFASTSQVVFKDCEDQYAGTDYITSADKLNDNQLTCLTTDAGRKFVRAGNDKVYVATVLKDDQKPTVQNLVYNGEEQTGVNVPPNTDTFYTITGTTAIQANTAYAQDSENYSGYTAKVELESGYALYHSNTYYVAGIPLNLVWRIEPKKAAASDFVVDASTLTTTYKEEYHGVTVTVAKKYTEHGEHWNGELEVHYLVDGTWTNAVPTDAGTYQLQVHIENDGNFAAGYVPLTDVLTIKPASQTKPDSNIFEVTAPTSVNGTDGKITGVNDNMEYSTDGQNWKPCDGNTITGPSGKYQIRYKAEQPNYDASPAIEVTIPPHVHNFCEEIVDSKYSAAPATCTEAATYYKSCACGTSSKGTVEPATFTVGNPLGHKYDTSKWESVDKTCHAHPCKICGAYDETSKAPHEFNGKEPNCKAIGCDYKRTMYDVTLTTDYADCSVTTQNGDPVTSIIGGVQEGTAVTVSGNTLRIGDETLTFSTNNGEQYSYTFTGWTINNQPIPENYTINKPVTITANFNCVVNQYTVTWDAAGGTIQDTVYTSGTQNWGTPITAPSKVVKAPDSSYSYTFAGWQDNAGNVPTTTTTTTVTGDVTYTAQYTKVAHVYEAGVWKYDDSGHWQVCTVSGCGYATEKTSHIYADADATVCTDCGASRTLPKLTGKVEIIGELAKGERLTVVCHRSPQHRHPAALPMAA